MVARPHAHDRLMTVLGALTIASTAIVPLAVMPDLLDRFHVIKESLLRAEAILGAFLLTVAFAVGGASRFREIGRHRLLIGMVTAAVAWCGVATLTSVRRVVSMDSLVSVVTSAALFFVVWYAAPRVGMFVLDALVLAVVVNGTLAALVEYGVYDPFAHGDPLLTRHLKATGLLGNPNVVGSWMALAAVVLTVASARIPGWRRWTCALGALAATASVLVSLTRTALIALVAGLLVFAIGSSIRRGAAVVVALALLFGLGIGFRVPLVLRVMEIPRLAAEGGLEVASSGRVAPALAAWEMFRDHPWTGVGPGAYHSNYTEYKARLWEKYPKAIQGTHPVSFGDAHNDHLQLLAETGLPGYALFLGVVGALWFTVARGKGDDPRSRFARAVAGPLVIAFLVLALAQFALHLAVTRHLLVTFAGLAAGWSRGWE